MAVAVRGSDGDIGGWRRPGGGSGPRWTCTYHAPAFYATDPENQIMSDPSTPVAGQAYLLRCRDQSGAIVREEAVVYDPGDPLGGLLAGERAAELAREELALPEPSLALSPPSEQVVGIPTWLAVDMAWAPVATSASVSNVTATVVATPISVAWSLGDGASLTCSGPGARFDPGRPLAEQSSDCLHTYVWPSHRQSGGTYTVEATVSYAVSWSATDGSSGELDDVTRSSEQPVRVLELQALIG